MSESPAAAVVDVSTSQMQQPSTYVQTPQTVTETREAPRSQSFVAEPPAPEPVHAPVAAMAPVASVPPVAEVAPVAEVTPPPAPRQDPKEALSSSGLVMIETDPSKPKSYQLEEEKVQLGRARRERPKNAEEQLKQVETKN